MPKYCPMHTPENVTHVFKIPKDARTDHRGFYVINEAFKKANPDKDFNYLNHDLIHRGPNSDNDFYENNGIRLDFPKHEVKHLRGPIKQKSDEWQETADAWLFITNDQTFDYFTGIGHRVPRPGLFHQDRKEYERLKNANLTEYGFKKLMGLTKAVPPSIEDLFYSLTMDASAASETFSDWCINFGYDTDSRKALSVYEACQESAVKLRKLGFNLDELNKYYEDF